jgi:hypothetical protein
MMNVPAIEAVDLRKAYGQVRALDGMGFPPLILAPVLLALAVIAVLHGFPPFPLIPLAFVVTRRHRRWNREAPPWI